MHSHTASWFKGEEGGLNDRHQVVGAKISLSCSPHNSIRTTKGTKAVLHCILG